MDKIDFCGIEVSAPELVLALERDGEVQVLKSFPNTPAGHHAVAHYLARPGRQVRVCLESTGSYGLDLASRLHQQAGVQVMVANPRAVRHFAAALMQRNKNDRVDAAVLREFTARMPFQAWEPPSAAARELRALARRLSALTEMQTAEKNRLHAALLTKTTPASVLGDLKRSLRAHHRAIDRLMREALKIIAQDPLLHGSYHLLLSARGIGPTSGVQILAELAVLSPDLQVRQWVAHASLDPREHSSGQSVRRKPRTSKAGNHHLRRALYMPALVAVRHDPHLRAFYQHLLALGKAKMQALVAVMRKLLHAIYGMFKHQQPYDGSKVYRIPETLAPSQFSTTEAA